MTHPWGQPNGQYGRVVAGHVVHMARFPEQREDLPAQGYGRVWVGVRGGGADTSSKQGEVARHRTCPVSSQDPSTRRPSAPTTTRATCSHTPAIFGFPAPIAGGQSIIQHRTTPNTTRYDETSGV